MVHALKEIHRVLKPGGTLIDLRPKAENAVVEVLLASATLRAGEVDSSNAYPEKYAADEVMKRLLADGLFRLEYRETFFYVTDFDTVADLRDYKASLDTDVLTSQVVQRVAMLTENEADDFSIHIRRPMDIARYRIVC